MTAQKPGPATGSRIDFACPDAEHVIVRIVGRGSFENSGSLRRVPELADRQAGTSGRARRFVFDLAQCTTMDSTFFGVLATLALGQRRAGLGDLVLLKVNKHLERLLQTLGLSRLMQVVPAPDGDGNAAAAAAAATSPAGATGAEPAFSPVGAAEVGKLDRIVLMLEAHQRLSELSPENELRFRNVIDCLEAALEEEQRGKPAS